MNEHDHIREVYRDYEQSGRDRLWDRRNPGFGRLISDRDERLLDLLARSLPPAPMSLLDVGCGDGALLSTVRQHWPLAQLTGIDLLERPIDEARTKVPQARFVMGSADAMPFADDTFDVVTAITLMSSIPSPDMEVAVAREIARVIRPGGWLIWFDLRYDNPSNRAVHGLDAPRLASLFPAWPQELRTSTVIPPIARRLGRLTPLLYPLLEAVPPLRSHLIGRLRCPI